MAMTVEIKNNKLCIEIDLEKPTPSSSGKTLVVASTRGNTVTKVEVDGKPVTIGLNAYIKPWLMELMGNYIDSKHAIAHNNIMIIDRNTLITGSFNSTKSAEESNAENLLILKGNKLLVERYIQNFEEHKGHSEEYVGR